MTNDTTNNGTEERNFMLESGFWVWYVAFFIPILAFFGIMCIAVYLPKRTSIVKVVSMEMMPIPVQKGTPGPLTLYGSGAETSSPGTNRSDVINTVIITQSSPRSGQSSPQTVCVYPAPGMQSCGDKQSDKCDHKIL